MFDNFFDIPTENIFSVTGLTKELSCIYIFDSFIKKDKNALVVANTIFEANEIYQRLLSYTPKVLFFPMDDFIPSEALAISPEFKIERLNTLNKLCSNEKYIVITNLMGVLRYLPTKKQWKSANLKIKKNQEISREDILNELYYLGYERVTIVIETGTIGVRGFVIDVFPIGEDNPIRIELWGNQIESIKYFNVETQLSISNIDEITILSFSEFLTKKNVENDCRKQKYLKYYEEINGIWDYVNNDMCFYFDYNQLISSYKLLRETIFEYDREKSEKIKTEYMFNFENITLSNNIYFLSFDNKIKNIINYNYCSYNINNFNNNINVLKKYINDLINDKKTVVLCIANKGTARRIINYLDLVDVVFVSDSNFVKNRVNLVNFSLTSGFIYENLIFISETDLFDDIVKTTTYKSKYKIGNRIHDIDKIDKGDYVVHEVFGIGIYQELTTILKNGLKKDYLKIIYAGSDILYVPIESINKIGKYASANTLNVKLSKLNTDDWQKHKSNVKKKLENIAGDLLKVSIQRETEKGYAFSSDDESQILFENEFLYDETKDQLIAIEKIKSEMEKSHPMDMLLCGDVGYGKTEVAFRAMFKAVNDGKQVAYLCPTTILSNQQYNSAKDRFVNFPINIALINRFVDKSKQTLILKDLKEGKIDILFGTHRMLSEDVDFKNLGLLVIDEEQRFGVKHKEKIKKYKANIDVLTLSATPIPRTLQMSISGVRSLSLIETPPADRFPIQTYVIEEKDVIIKEAIYKELSRDGQVFLLYNNVQKIEEKSEYIKRLVPEAKITFAHGQMTKTELENRMNDFTIGKFNVLICTTIIETGIDIPSVNTLIIFDADRFGLSQLYQIRGRIGRSNKIGYAYLMYNSHKVLTDVAIKRLDTIKEFTKLGSGFKIAMRDLSIRGAGDILGKEQSGYIDTIGIDLYLKMLNEAVMKANGIEVKEDEEIKNVKPLLEVETSIDNNYVDNEELKIEIHKKINSIDSFKKFSEVKTELIDRFGNISKNMLVYMYYEWFCQVAKSLNIVDVKEDSRVIDINLPVKLSKSVNPEKLFEESYEISSNFKLKYVNNHIHIILKKEEKDEKYLIYMIQLLNKILNKEI